MRICYVLLSPTFGMHQYTADIANRMAVVGHDVHLVTTTRAPRDRYAPAIAIHTPVATRNTGFSSEGLHLGEIRTVQRTICDLNPDVVHFGGPHFWNTFLVRDLMARGLPVIHTLHDLDPHQGTRYGALIKVWNQVIIGSAQHILVHGQTYQSRLVEMGVPPERVTYTPLMHLFLSLARSRALAQVAATVKYEPWALFFGRLEPYKGVDNFLTACAMLRPSMTTAPRAVLAGPGNLSAMWSGPLPNGVEVRNHQIEDEEAIDLFRRCGLVVLPYVDASQSALIAAAYYFRKPVVVTRTGALPEYVVDGQTGWVVEPGHPASLGRCLEEMLSDPAQLAQMGSAGRTWYDACRAAEMRTLVEMYQQLGRNRTKPDMVTGYVGNRLSDLYSVGGPG